MFACILLFGSEHVFPCDCETAGVRVVDVVSVYTYKASMCVLPQDVFHKPCVSTSMLSAKTFYLNTWFPQLAQKRSGERPRTPVGLIARALYGLPRSRTSTKCGVLK